MKKQRGLIFSVPEPCHEKWDEMTPNEKGRHCSSCNKTVVDFSLYTDKELLDFISKSAGSICGRLNNHQLNRPITYTESSNPSILKRIAVGTALATTLAACNNTETKTTGKVACNKDTTHIVVGGLQGDPVVVDTSHNHCYIYGTVRDEKNAPAIYANVKIDEADYSVSTDSNGYYKIKVADSLIGKRVKMIFTTFDGVTNHRYCNINKLPFKMDFEIKPIGTCEVNMVAGGLTYAPIHDSDKVYTVVEKMPKYKNLYEYLANKIEYPKPAIDANIEGTVYLTFIIEKTGEVSNAKIIKGIPGGSELDSVALNVIRNMPKWIPGKQAGEPVRVQYTLPVHFELSDKDSAKKG